MLHFKIHPFTALSTNQLYAILALRNQVFIVEQDCVYQDLDQKDQQAHHVLGYINHTLVAYARIFKPGYYFKEASIGRVVVAKNVRHNNYGFRLMQEAIIAVEKYYQTKTIKISAQLYLKIFYESLGFQQIGEEYLEDGIPHIAMLKHN